VSRSAAGRVCVHAPIRMTTWGLSQRREQTRRIHGRPHARRNISVIGCDVYNDRK